MAGLLTAEQLAAMKDTTESTFDKVATRRRFPVVKDRYNDEIRDLDNPDDLEDVPVVLWQVGADESRADRDQQAGEWLARVPVDTDVDGRDQLIVGDDTYEVVGPPLDARTHLRLKLSLVEG